MKIKILVVFLAFTLLSTTCVRENDKCHARIHFQNDLENDIYTEYYFDYPDTMALRHPSGIQANAYFTKVYANSLSDRTLDIGDCWETIFKYKKRIPSDTLMVYVFDSEVVENEPWDNISKNYLVLQRYDLSLEDLRYLDWKLTYPPCENMRYMKMYPPYPEE